MKLQFRTQAILLGVGTFLVSLLITAPAALVGHALPEKFVLNGIDGSLWGGSANSAYVDKVQLGSIHWRLRPIDLLKGRLGFAVDLKPPQVTGQGNIAIGIRGMHASNMKLAWDAQALTPYLQGFGELEGRFSLDLKYLALSGHGVRSVEGLLSWDRARVRYPNVLRLGDLDAKLMNADSSSIAVLKNEGGDLDLSGNVSMDAEGNYQVRLTYIPTRRTRNEVREAISLLGKPDKDGRVTVERSGRLGT